MLKVNNLLFMKKLIKPNRFVFSNLLQRNESSNKMENNHTEVNSNYENRNPRNLEWSGHQYKRTGWNLHYPPKDFYHQCVLVKHNHGLEAFVEHHSNGVLFKISTTDLSLRQHLFSPQDMSAAISLGKVFAERCKRAGITHMRYLKGNSFDSSSKEQAFYNTLVQSGLILEEEEFKERTNEIPGIDYDNKDFYHERLNVPFPPYKNKIKRQALEKILAEKNSSPNS